jgi:hypothetical protein
MIQQVLADRVLPGLANLPGMMNHEKERGKQTDDGPDFAPHGQQRCHCRQGAGHEAAGRAGLIRNQNARHGGQGEHQQGTFSSDLIDA